MMCNASKVIKINIKGAEVWNGKEALLIASLIRTDKPQCWLILDLTLSQSMTDIDVIIIFTSDAIFNTFVLCPLSRLKQCTLHTPLLYSRYISLEHDGMLSLGPFLQAKKRTAIDVCHICARRAFLGEPRTW